MRTHFQKIPELTPVHVLALEGARPSTNFLMPGPAASPAQQHVEATRRGSLHLPGEAGLLTAFPRMHHLKRDGPQVRDAEHGPGSWHLVGGRRVGVGGGGEEVLSGWNPMHLHFRSSGQEQPCLPLGTGALRAVTG